MEDLVLVFVQMFDDMFDAAATFIAAYDGGASSCAHEACGRSFMMAFGMV